MTESHQKYTFVDLFAGAGGFGLGFQMSGLYRPLCSIEKDLWAVETLRANNEHSIIHSDIAAVSSNALINHLCNNNKPDIIIGGPPCQGFSIAGKRDPNDPRNSLFRYYVKWVTVLTPKVFVMENVVGLLTRKNADGENVIDIIKNAFIEIGYNCQVWVLNAASYGVPQMRQRVFIVGNQYKQEIMPPTPTHSIENKEGLLPAITAWQAISDLPQIKAREGNDFMDYDCDANNDYQRECRKGSLGVYNHVAMQHTQRLVKRFQKILDGSSIESLPEELKVRKRNGNGELSKSPYSSNYRHLNPNAVSYTIPASFYSTFIHPFIPRNITAREAARIQSFPDRYIFKGKRTQVSSKLLATLGKEEENHLSQYNQIGNAVPPLLARVIGERIAEFLDTL